MYNNGNPFVNNLKGDFHMKKFLALALALVFVFSFAACGGTDDAANNTPTKSLKAL